MERYRAFSLAEALITLLIVAIITLATIPVITKKHRNKLNTKHGYFACYWVNGNLIARYKENGNITSGEVKYDDEMQKMIKYDESFKTRAAMMRSRR